MLKTFAIETLGCKVNQYESRQIQTLLQQFGLTAAKQGQIPDLTLVNSCCITHTASSKSRQMVRKMLKNNKNGIVILLGCLSRAPESELENLNENVIIIKNRSNIDEKLSQIVLNSNVIISEKTEIISQNDILKANIKQKNASKIKSKNHTNLCNLPQLTSYQGQTRAFLKAQDGCDNYCTYCIIPFVRPDITSRDADQIIDEARQLVLASHKEIVLTGINLGAYKRPTTRRKNWKEPDADHLADLLNKLAQIDNLPRIRVSSLNPQDITDKLLDIFCENKNIMPHLHLSLQSGSDNILNKMNRQYTSADYLQKVRMIKERLDIPAITTDIIVGFPGETDDDFEQTLELARQVDFSRIHVFSFSARKGTAAFNMKQKVKPEVIKSRASELQKLADRLAYDYRQQFVGKTAEVLIETVEDNIATGRAERYFEVKIEDPDAKLQNNDIVTASFVSNTENHLVGEIS
jgi:threonylcarbamoyladenosine tRNA methylthiotransferase MtaB